MALWPRALLSLVVLVVSLAACGSPMAGTQTTGSVEVTLESSLTISESPATNGEQGTPDSAQTVSESSATKAEQGTPDRFLTASEVPVIKVTDEGSAGLTKEQAEIVRDCLSGKGGGVSSISDCVMPRIVSEECEPNHYACFKVENIGGNKVAVQIEDQSPEQSICGMASERCPKVVLESRTVSRVQVMEPPVDAKVAPADTPTAGTPTSTSTATATRMGLPATTRLPFAPSPELVVVQTGDLGQASTLAPWQVLE